MKDACLGKYALERTDDKGRQLLDFIRNNELKVANTFFRANDYCTFKSFNRNGSTHQIDHVLTSKELLFYIESCSVDNSVATSSNHSAIKTILRLRAPKKAQKACKKKDWHKLMKADVKESFNEILSNMVDNCVGLSYQEFNNYIKDVANKVVRDDVEDKEGWFEFSSDVLRPLIERRNCLLARARASEGCDEDLKQQCRDAKSDLKDAVAVAKGRWIEHLVDKISQIKMNPKEAWDNIKFLSNGFSGHYAVKKSLKFRSEDGKIATTNRENAILAGEHFTKVFNRDARVDWDHVDRTAQKEMVISLAAPLTFGEFVLAIEKLCWHKSPGKNGVSPNMIKALDDTNRRVLFMFMCDWMENEDMVFDDWLESRLVPLPKKGDLHDLNNWRGINLIDVCSKVMSIILNARAQKLIKINGHPMQFGATPKVGCAEAVFSLKSILQARREMGLDTYAIFIDLVKAYDSVRHDVISLALRKMGAPEKYIKWIEKLHQDFGVTLKIGREEIYIKYGCGVRQGDNLAPTLFIIVMQLVAEDIIRQLKEENVVIPSVRYNDRGGGVLRAYKSREVKEMCTLEVNMFTYVDDGAMLFESRGDTERASPIVCRIIAKWGLTAHVGYDGKQSKTELMFFPSTVTIARWRKEALLLGDGFVDECCDVDVRTKRFVDLKIKYTEAPETRDIIVDERGGTLSFTNEFLYLGSSIDFLIDDTTDVKNRISKASKSMGALKFIWDAVEVPLPTKIKLYQAIPMNLMLWGGENWSGNKADIKLLDTFHHKSIRRILGISMGRVRDEEITNSEIRRRFGSIESLSVTWRKRQLLFIGRIVRLDRKLYPPLLLTATVDGKRSRGRPFHTVKDAFVDSLTLVFPSLDRRGKVSVWIDVARNATEWSRIVKRQEQRGNGNFDSRRNNNDDSNVGSDDPGTPAINPTPHVYDRYNITPQRLKPISDTMSKSDALKVLNLDGRCSDREIRRMYRLLARKYHPDKWSERCMFSRNDGEEIFKCISNAFIKLCG